MAEDTGSSWYEWLSRHPWICARIESFYARFGDALGMIVHARSADGK